jgi:polar amino acid transport system substrate-binding protein
MFIKPDRCKQVAFSDPMFCAPNAFMVPMGNPDNITDFESVAKAGIKLGVFSGAVEGDYAKTAGVSGSKIVTVPDMPAGVTQLQQGRIRAIGLTSITLNWAVKQDPSINAEVTEPFTPVVNARSSSGMALRRSARATPTWSTPSTRN